MKSKTVVSILCISLVFLITCAGASRQEEPLVKAISLTIKSPVKAGIPYQASILCNMPSTGIDNIKGHFFWNQEGPFEYSLASYDTVDCAEFGRCAKMNFMLYTGRPSTYTISGYLIYRNTANSMMGRTSALSAGAVTVK